MPSWSQTESPPTEAAAAPEAATRATAIERARRLLEQILTSVSRNDEPPQPKP